MQNAPIEMDHYKLRVVEAPTLKMRQLYKDDKRVGEEPASGPNGEARYEVVLYVRARQADQYGRKDSEEIRVELPQPCDDIEEDDVVELVGSRVSVKTYPSKKSGGMATKVDYSADAMTKAS